MTCTQPRNDRRRPVCGQPAVVVYTHDGEAHPRCKKHDSVSARWYASSHVGWGRDPLTLAEVGQ